MDWRIKGIIQKILAATPGGSRLNSAMQLRMGGLRHFERNVDTKVIGDWLVLASHMQRLGIPIEGRVFVEVGTGWYPTLPVCFHLAGAAGCHTIDLHRLMDWTLLQRMLARLGRHLPAIAAQLSLDEQTLKDRLARLQRTRGQEEFLQAAGIEYRAPADATSTGLPDAGVDVVFSNSVLEHVPEPVIRALMKESRRVLRPGGIALHSVNCGDHYAYFDKRVTQIHYLRHGPASWWLWNNDLQYQNRLRANDFLALAREAGLTVVLDIQRPRPELLATIDAFPIAPEFQHYSREQLCTTSIDFVASKGS
ncbi:MAG: class I SAM-dependent methyltransferase [Steroidobacteraceae bacterium]